MRFSTTHSLTPKSVENHGHEVLKEYNKELKNLSKTPHYSKPESLLKLAYDEANIASIMQMKEFFVTKDLKYIIVIGIGGSNLGAKAIYDAIYGYSDLFEEERLPKIIFLETLSPNYTKKVLKFLQKKVKKEEDILAVLITKSGTTAETLINFEILENAIPKIKGRTVYIANENAPLTILAKKRNLPYLTIPIPVPGRFSVFSPAGLFPLACADIDVISLLEGALQYLELNFESNSISLAAITSLMHYREGKIIHENFLFDSRLEGVGKWQRQLLAESLGKTSTLGITEGIQPSYSIGTTDLHSVFQLFLGGPQIRYFNLTSVTHLDQNKANENKGISDNRTLKEIYNNVKNKFQEEKIPFAEFTLESVCEKELGAYMQFKMIETILLGHLLRVNTFDQPNVDSYKKEVNGHH